MARHRTSPCVVAITMVRSLSSQKTLFKVVTDDKYDDRWTRGVFVGKLDQTDEAILLTPASVAKARGIKRLEEGEKFKFSFLNSCKGLPRNPKAAESIQRCWCGKAIP